MTRRVKLYGLPSEEVRVELDETRLSMLGISIGEVSAALAEADARAPAGQLTGAGAALTVELTGDFTDLESIRNVIVRGLPDGRAIRISDLAEVRKTEVTPFESMSLSNGQRSVLIAAEMQPGYQVDRYGAQFDEFLAAYRAGAPNGVSIETSFDQVGYSVDRLLSVGKNLLLGIMLVIAVLLVTLGWRAALVVAVILPLCTLMSMTGLVLPKNSDSTNVGDRTGRGTGLAGRRLYCDDRRDTQAPAGRAASDRSHARRSIAHADSVTVLHPDHSAGFYSNGLTSRRRGRFFRLDRRSSRGDARVLFRAGGRRDACTGFPMVACWARFRTSLVASRRRQQKIGGGIPALIKLVNSQPARRLRPRLGATNNRLSLLQHTDPAVFPWNRPRSDVSGHQTPRGGVD